MGRAHVLARRGLFTTAPNPRVGCVLARDYPLIMGVLVIGAVLTLLGNLIADLSYALVDPRIRTGS